MGNISQTEITARLTRIDGYLDRVEEHRSANVNDGRIAYTDTVDFNAAKTMLSRLERDAGGHLNGTARTQIAELRRRLVAEEPRVLREGIAANLAQYNTHLRWAEQHRTAGHPEFAVGELQVAHRFYRAAKAQFDRLNHLPNHGDVAALSRTLGHIPAELRAKAGQVGEAAFAARLRADRTALEANSAHPHQPLTPAAATALRNGRELVACVHTVFARPGAPLNAELGRVGDFSRFAGTIRTQITGINRAQQQASRLIQGINTDLARVGELVEQLKTSPHIAESREGTSTLLAQAQQHVTELRRLGRQHPEQRTELDRQATAYEARITPLRAELDRLAEVDPHLLSMDSPADILRHQASLLKFEGNPPHLTARAERALDNIAQFLNANPNLTGLQIEGHTDNHGDRTHNRAVSQERADAIRNALVARGVEASRLSAHGYGSDRPLRPNLTAAGRTANRRIEIHIARTPEQNA